MDASLAQTKIKTALKSILKRQNHTYADVAKVWDCSVPTVKRQLGPEEMPLSRLLALLEWLNLSMSELEKIAASETLEAPRYTSKQNEFLAKNPREFSFLMKLYEDKTPPQIAKEYKIPQKDLEKILIQLEKYDLIRVGAGGKIKPAYEKMPSADGALGKAHLRRIIDRGAEFQKAKLDELIDLQVRGFEGVGANYSWAILNLSEKSYREALKSIEKIIVDLQQTSKIEKQTLKKAELKIAAINTAAFYCANDDRYLPLIRDVMDVGLREASESSPLPR